MAMPYKKTRVLILLAIALGVVLVVVGYKPLSPADPVVDLGGASAMSLSLHTNGQNGKAKPLPPDAKLVAVIEKILAAKRGTWSWTLITYAQVVYIRSDLFSINFQPNQVIVNYAIAQDRWVQVVTDLTDEESAELQRALQ